MKECDLYPPVKAYLKARGYAVKGEVGGCDVVATRPDAPPLIVELKLSFSLELVFQGVRRQAMTADVYLAAARPRRRGWGRRYRDINALCRRLGLGLLAVDPATGACEAMIDPAPYVPRAAPRRRAALLREFDRRRGDPTPGGVNGRKIMTAYRQDALRCARALSAAEEPRRGAEVAAETGVARATRMMRDDHYGWFERPGRGLYRLTEAGRRALSDHAAMLDTLD